jgi:(2R)-ethylmalonyl-CoA mutase
VVESLTKSIMDGARTELDQVLAMGGVVAAVESGYLKSALVASLAERRRRLESGDDVVVGVNRYAETEPSPLTAAGAAPVVQVDPEVEAHAIADVTAWRDKRDPVAVEAALDALRAAASSSTNLMASTLECVKVGVTTGEWAGVLRSVFGEYRAPTGLSGSGLGSGSEAGASLSALRERVRATAAELGSSRLRLLVGKPGLDGHSNGAEQIAVRARDAGFEVIYQGIRLTPAEIVAAAVEEGVDLVGLSVLSGSHLRAVPDVLEGLRRAGVDVPVVVGGIIPPEDERTLLAAGVARVFTPKDFELTGIIDGMVSVVRAANHLSA